MALVYNFNCCICYDISTWWCRRKHYVFRLCLLCLHVRSFVCPDWSCNHNIPWTAWPASMTDSQMDRQTDTITCTSPHYPCVWWLHGALQLLLIRHATSHTLNASDVAYCYRYYMQCGLCVVCVGHCRVLGPIYELKSKFSIRTGDDHVRGKKKRR